MAEPQTSTQYLDRDGKPLRMTLGAEDAYRRSLSIVDCPDVFVSATLAAEDKRFWEHAGVDWLATARAFKDMLRAGRVVSGASTITQQLIKISSPSRPRTLGTKLREALAARRLEMTWSKAQILEAYLNRLDYGNLRLGPAEATRCYFQKPLAELSLAECALLAGLPQAPSRLNPVKRPAVATTRRNTVLTRLAAAGKIAESRITAALTEPLTLRLTRGEGLVLSLAIIDYGEAQKLLIARDITLAEKVETMRRDFVAHVSHELKSPLTVVAGFLETLTDGAVALDERKRLAYMELMRDHTQRMQRLVEDLLTLSALESSRGLSDETAVSIAALLAGLRDEALALSAGRHRIALEADERVSLFANAQELRSAFGNLVINAVRYTPEGGDIRLAWARRGAQAVFSVSDSGPGIEPRHVPRLTERFYRVDNSRSRETGGTGLGLAIVKHILTRHQAALEIESEPGRGSVFSAVFPAQRVREAAVAATVAVATRDTGATQ